MSTWHVRFVYWLEEILARCLAIRPRVLLLECGEWLASVQTRVRAIMRKNFAKIMRALFANYFCHFLPKTFLGFVLHMAEYRIDLFYVYGIDKIAYRHLQKLRTLCIAWPDRLH